MNPAPAPAPPSGRIFRKRLKKREGASAKGDGGGAETTAAAGDGQTGAGRSLARREGRVREKRRGNRISASSPPTPGGPRRRGRRCGSAHPPVRCTRRAPCPALPRRPSSPFLHLSLPPCQNWDSARRANPAPAPAPPSGRIHRKRLKKGERWSGRGEERGVVAASRSPEQEAVAFLFPVLPASPFSRGEDRDAPVPMAAQAASDGARGTRFEALPRPLHPGDLHVPAKIGASSRHARLGSPLHAGIRRRDRWWRFRRRNLCRTDEGSLLLHLFRPSWHHWDSARGRPLRADPVPTVRERRRDRVERRQTSAVPRAVGWHASPRIRRWSREQRAGRTRPGPERGCAIPVPGHPLSRFVHTFASFCQCWDSARQVSPAPAPDPPAA